MDHVSLIPKVQKPVSIQENKEDPFAHQSFEHQHDEEQKKRKEQDPKHEEHHGGNNPALGHEIDIDA